MWMNKGEIASDYRMAKDPAKQIKILAELNGVTRAEIEDVLVEYGLKPKRRPRPPGRRSNAWTAEDIAELRRLHAEGIPREEIADRMQRSYLAIKSKMTELRLVNKNWRKNQKMNGKEWTSEEVASLLSKKKMGMTVPQIAADLGRTEVAIKGKLKKLREEGKQIAAQIFAEEAEQAAEEPPAVAVVDVVPDSVTPADMMLLAQDFARLDGLFGKTDRVVMHSSGTCASLTLYIGETYVRVERYHTA